MGGANRAMPESHRKDKNYLDIPSLLPKIISATLTLNNDKVFPPHKLTHRLPLLHVA